MSRNAVQSLLAVTGIVGPVMFTTLIFVGGSLRPGYNQIAGLGMSELGVGPNAIIFNAGAIAFGLLTVAFALGLQRGVGEGRGPKTGPVLIGLSGASFVGLGTFTAQRETLTIHQFLASIAFITSILAPILIRGRMKRDVEWQRYRSYSMMTGIVALAVFIALIAGVPQFAVSDATFQALSNGVQNAGQGVLGPWAGGVQRLFFAVTWLWIEVMALRLLTISRLEPSQVQNRRV